MFFLYERDMGVSVFYKVLHKDILHYSGKHIF